MKNPNPTNPTDAMIEAGVRYLDEQRSEHGSFRDDVKAIYRAMEAARPSPTEGGWQPIETHSGRLEECLLWVPNSDIPDGGVYFLGGQDEEGNWWSDMDGPSGVNIIHPTHWQPLPKAPEEK